MIFLLLSLVVTPDKDILLKTTEDWIILKTEVKNPKVFDGRFVYNARELPTSTGFDIGWGIQVKEKP